jgi:alkyldihydroxyacetonephosphate synthase
MVQNLSTLLQVLPFSRSALHRAHGGEVVASVQRASRYADLRSRLEEIVPGVSEPGREYESDTYWLGLLGQHSGRPVGSPDVVVRPTSVEQISAIVRFAAGAGIPIVPWGAGSGSQGGAIAINGGIQVDMRGLDRLIEVDKRSLTATVQTGMMCDVFEAALNEREFIFPHYPASTAIATVGGYVACRGSGVLSTRYGKIEDLIISLQVVLPDGSVIRTLPVPRHAVGPDLNQVFTGSEGTLGIITEMTVQILPTPECRTFHAVQFEDIHTGIDAGRSIIQSGIRPSVVRLYDEVAASGSLGQVIGEVLDRPTMVLLFEGPTDLAETEARLALRLAAAHGARSIDPIVAQHWWEHRYDFYAPPHAPQLPSMWGTIEAVARYSDIDAIYDRLRREIPERYARYHLRLAIHLSHWYPWGTMLYGRFVIPSAPDDANEAAALHDRIWADAIDIALDGGGVMNDHHGVGLKLGPFMRQQYGPAFTVLEAIKGALDPAGVMNPGKLGFNSGHNDGRTTE